MLCWEKGAVTLPPAREPHFKRGANLSPHCKGYSKITPLFRSPLLIQKYAYCLGIGRTSAKAWNVGTDLELVFWINCKNIWRIKYCILHSSVSAYLAFVFSVWSPPTAVLPFRFCVPSQHHFLLHEFHFRQDLGEKKDWQAWVVLCYGGCWQTRDLEGQQIPLHWCCCPG